MTTKLRVVPTPRDNDPVLTLLAPYLEHGVLPEDLVILCRLIPTLSPDARTLLRIEELVRAGELRRVIIGTEPHLARGRGDSTPAQSVLHASASDDVDFDTELAADVESERIVLYRVAMVLLALGFIAIVREWLLILLT